MTTQNPQGILDGPKQYPRDKMIMWEQEERYQRIACEFNSCQITPCSTANL